MKIIQYGYKEHYNELVFSFLFKFHSINLKIKEIKNIRNLIILLQQRQTNLESLQVITVKITIINKIEIQDLEVDLEHIITTIGKDQLHNYFLNVSVIYMLKQIKLILQKLNMSSIINRLKFFMLQIKKKLSLILNSLSFYHNNQNFYKMLLKG